MKRARKKAPKRVRKKAPSPREIQEAKDREEAEGLALTLAQQAEWNIVTTLGWITHHDYVRIAQYLVVWRRKPSLEWGRTSSLEYRTGTRGQMSLEYRSIARAFDEEACTVERDDPRSTLHRGPDAAPLEFMPDDQLPSAKLLAAAIAGSVTATGSFDGAPIAAISADEWKRLEYGRTGMQVRPFRGLVKSTSEHCWTEVNFDAAKVRSVFPLLLPELESMDQDVRAAFASGKPPTKTSYVQNPRRIALLERLVRAKEPTLGENIKTEVSRHLVDGWNAAAPPDRQITLKVVESLRRPSRAKKIR